MAFLQVMPRLRLPGPTAELENSANPPQKSLQSLLQIKQRKLQTQIGSVPPEELQYKLTAVPPTPAPNALLGAIRRSRGVSVIAEVARFSPSETPQALASRCNEYFASSGVDAIAVRTDEEVSPDGLADLTAVSASLDVPVIRTDWILHPVQIAEAREAGAAAVTTVRAVLQQGLPGIIKYATFLGLDPVVEVVNLKELDAVSKIGVSLCGINLSIKLSLAVPGFRQEIAKSLIRELPIGVQSIVGIQSIEEALEMKLAGASAVYVKHEIWQGKDETFFERLQDVLNN